MAGFEGLRYSDLLKMILEAAQKRIAAENGFSNNASVPKEKIISDRILIVSTPDELKVTHADLKS